MQPAVEAKYQHCGSMCITIHLHLLRALGASVDIARITGYQQPTGSYMFIDFVAAEVLAALRHHLVQVLHSLRVALQHGLGQVLGER